MPIITRAQIAALAPHARPDIVAGICDHADDVLPRYNLATRARLVDFVAHITEETGGFTAISENLNYSAERAHEVWPSRFPTAAAAAPYAGNPQALANCVYGGRMGNVQSGDGWRFRGQGLLQTTGRANCTALAKTIGKSVDEVVLMLTSEAGMLECAAASYVATGAPKYADKGDIVGSTRAVNGGLINIDRREAYRAQCLKLWPGEPVVPRAVAAVPVADAHPAPIPAVKPVVAPPPPLPPMMTTWHRLWAMFTGKAA